MFKIPSNIIFVIAFFLFSTGLFAQSLDYVQGELLIQLAENQKPEDLIREFEQTHGRDAALQINRKLRAPMSVWKFSFDFNAINNDLLILQLNRLRAVSVVQNNHLISPRATIPDDPLFASQWQWFNDGSSGTLDADVDAELAWDITTGGLTPDGDEIVVAVLDDGTELTHPDLIDNHWVNTAEIPDNDIDDDGNGYVDDYNGWSIITDNDVVTGGNHGVAVSGMVGAKGNNGIGVTGINWDVKVMMVKNNFNTQEDRVLEAYAYPYIMRKRYNESGGAEGAFVVASNASWGIDGGDPADSPLWCQFYDSLGVQGILNCGATSNSTVNIDEIGDLPTTCPSDFMVSVTRSSIDDTQSGGFGPIHIDLAAPGQNIFITDDGASYGNTTGTSFSSPLVAGIIALMYSAPCPNLTSLAKSNPGEAALEARRLLLSNVDLLTGFEFLVESGGRANAFNAIAEIVANCGPCPGPRSLAIQNTTLTSTELTWIDGNNATSAAIRFRVQGTPNWTNIPTATSPYGLTGLAACTDYEFQVANECLDSMATSDFTPSVVFRTDGCCEAPANITASNIQNMSADISWDPVTLAESYTLRHRLAGVMIWEEQEVTDINVTLDALAPCQEYEVAVKTNCPGINSDFSPSILVSTTGCGPCIENAYCQVEGNANLENIDQVILNGVNNNTGSNDGYALFDSDPPTLLLGSDNQLKIIVGYASFSYDEVFTVFIDYNSDGIFSSDENIGNVSQSDSVTFDFTVPFTATLGLTRMRVIMGFQANVDNACPNDLEGEVEDYCVFLDDPMVACDFVGLIDTIGTTNSSIQLTWPEQTAALQYQVRWKENTMTDWSAVLVQDNNYEFTDLPFCTLYDFQVATVCFDGLSPFSNEISFSSGCNTGIEDELKLQQFTLSPNPFSDVLNFAFDSPVSGQLNIQILSSIGQVMTSDNSHRITRGANSITLDRFENLNSGIYFLSLSIEDLHKVVKVIKH